MNDTSDLGRPDQDDDQLRHTLTVHEVSNRLAAAGVPRSDRQIKRYCECGFLDAKKIPGPTGDQWFVAPVALPRLIGDLQQWQMQRAGHVTLRPTVTTTVSPDISNENDVDMPGLGRPQPAMSIVQRSNEKEVVRPVASDYVMQLEKRIDEKDDVIGLLKGQLVAKDHQITDLSTRFGNLSDRFADTQKLLGAMQRMFAPLLGQGDPYSAGESSSASHTAEPPAVDNGQITPWSSYNERMEHIGHALSKIERNMQLDGFDRITAAGFTMVPNAIQNDPNLEMGEKAVYAQFLQYAWHHDYCFPSQERIAKNLGVSRTLVTKFVSGLAKKGLLTIERRGLGKTNYYTLHATLKRKGNKKKGTP